MVEIVNWRPWALVLTTLLLSCSGCGRTTARSVAVFPVDGQVLYQGKPAAGAVVTFHPLGAKDQQSIACVVRSDGHFVATQADGAIGLPEGNYALTLEWVTGDADRFAGRYSEPSHPLRTVKVESTVNLLAPINLK